MRIVSLVPSISELLADLGLDDETVGLTRFCVRPEGWKSHKTIVGGTKDVRIDRVRSLWPDLVIANREENIREQVEEVATFTEVHVTDVATVNDALTMIGDIGRLVGRYDAAKAMIAEIESRFSALGEREPLPAAYLIWREPYMSIGGDTFISDVMTRAGLQNVFAHQRRYPEVSVADIGASGARAVLLSSEPYPFKDVHAEELRAQLPGIPVALVDGQLFSWYGSRMREMPPYLRTLTGELTR